MEIEHLTKSFPVDNDLQKQVQELEAQGWQQIPGIPPVITYHLARPKQVPEAPKQPETPPLPHSLGKLLINDDLIMVHGPDGKPK